MINNDIKNNREILRALSIRQPYVEQILQGIKKIEYRTRPTKIRERVYLYAGLRPADMEVWEDFGMNPGDLPAGLIIGSVEVIDCTVCEEYPEYYEWHLINPERLDEFLKPVNQPQPAWFYPFGKK